MTGAQIVLIKRTWNIFRNIDPALVGDVFYSRLFSKYPRLEKMFRSSMTEQYKKLMDMLTMIVARLERLDEITEEIRQLAIRHTGYGVKPEHYAAVGESLLWTLEKGLGDDWTPEAKEAWTKWYDVLSNEMIGAANQHEKSQRKK